MAIKYKKLWELLDEQDVSRDDARKAAGLTTAVFSRIENDTSVQIEALLRICGALNCRLEDIAEWDYAYQPNHAIPNVDLDALPTDQFETLGYHKLYDLPIRFTAEGLSNYLTRAMGKCLLSHEACNCLADKLSEYGVQIELPDTVPLLFDDLPHAIPIDEDGNMDLIADQRIGNAIRETFRKISKDPKAVDSILNQAKQTVKPVKKYWIEEGILHASPDGYHTYFEGTMLDHRSLGSKAVMVDVYTDVFGPYDSGCWFPDIFDRMSVDTYCADAFKTKDDPTKKLLKVMFFYQLSIDELLLLFELPTWDSFRQIFQGKIRWLCHPHRSRWFYRNDMTVRDRWNWRGQNVFDALKEEIQRQLREKSKDKNVFEILEQYYPEDTILQVKEHYYEWFDGSDYTVDQLRISWKENYALKSAGIRTLQDFFEYLKGKTTAAGTKIPGIDEIGFERLKSLAFQFAQSEISGDQVRNLCNYAETVVTRECRWPIEECRASVIKDATRQSLYRLKYRDMMKVINDFKNGQLQRQCADKLPVQEATQLLKEVGYIARGEYPVIHVVTDAFWPEYLDKHPEQSIQNIRESYLQGACLDMDLADLDNNIPALFPGSWPVFPILRDTRKGEILWREFPGWLLSAFESVCSGEKSEGAIESAFWGKKSDTGYGEAWLYVAITKNGESGASLYSLNCRPQWEDYGVENLRKEIQTVDGGDMALDALSDAISFSCQLTASREADVLEYADQYQYTVHEVWEYVRKNSSPEMEAELLAEYSGDIDTAEKYGRLLDVTIEELDLSTIPFMHLRHANVATVRDLMRLSAENRWRDCHLGNKSIAEIQQKLRQMGLM